MVKLTKAEEENLDQFRKDYPAVWQVLQALVKHVEDNEKGGI